VDPTHSRISPSMTKRHSPHHSWNRCGESVQLFDLKSSRPWEATEQAPDCLQRTRRNHDHLFKAVPSESIPFPLHKLAPVYLCVGTTVCSVQALELVFVVHAFHCMLPCMVEQVQHHKPLEWENLCVGFQSVQMRLWPTESHLFSIDPRTGSMGVSCELSLVDSDGGGGGVRVLRRPVIRPDVQLLRLAIVVEGGD